MRILSLFIGTCVCTDGAVALFGGDEHHRDEVRCQSEFMGTEGIHLTSRHVGERLEGSLERHRVAFDAEGVVDDASQSNA